MPDFVSEFVFTPSRPTKTLYNLRVKMVSGSAWLVANPTPDRDVRSEFIIAEISNEGKAVLNYAGMERLGLERG
jgi:hypothetical protein